MEWFQYLNYKIYAFYRSKKETDPVLFAFLAVVALITINIFLIWILVLLTFIPVDVRLELGSKYYVILLEGLIAFFNYMIIYYKKKHIGTFSYFDNNKSKYMKWDKSVRAYIIGSVIFLLVTLIVVDLQNHNWEFYYLK